MEPSQRAITVVIEPPVTVANSLLEAARRLAYGMAERGVHATWTGPDFYSAVLATAGADDAENRLGATAALRTALRNMEEFAIQVSALRPIAVSPPLAADAVAGLPLPDPVPDEVTMGFRLTARGDGLDRLRETVVETLKRHGFAAEPVDDAVIPVAMMSGAGAVKAAWDMLLPTGDSPFTGWLLGGVCLASGATTVRGWLMPGRIRFFPLKRFMTRDRT